MAKGMIWFVLGLILAMGGVGGVETSLTNLALVQGALLALAGIGLMALGVSYVHEEQEGHKRKISSLP